MADKKITQLDPAAALTGAELVPVVQSGGDVRTTTQAIADLVTAGNFDYADLNDATTADLPGVNVPLAQALALKADLSSISPIGNHLLSGGGVGYAGGLNLIVSASTYAIQGITYTSPQTSLALAAADPTLDRIDVIAVNSSGAAIVITGTPDASPVRPDVDPESQLELTFFLVQAAATTIDVTVTDVYHENTEWTTSRSGTTFTLASTNNPRAGTVCIEGTAATTGNYFQFATTAFDPADYENLTFYVRSKATWASTRSISITLRSGNTTQRGTLITFKDGTFGFDSSQVLTYQQIVIPMSLFGANGLSADRIRFAVVGTGTTLGGYFDDFTLQNGAATNAPGSGPVNLVTGVTGVLPIANGGTAASTAAGARTNLGIGTAGTLAFSTDDTMAADSDALLPTQQAVKGYVDAQFAGAGTGDVVGPASATANALALFDGTTGKLLKDSGYTITAAGAALLDDVDASAQRTTLGLAIGTNVQAYDAQLADIAGITFAQGDVLYFNGTNLAKLGAGTSGHFLKTNGAGANPAWAAAAGGGLDLGWFNVEDYGAVHDGSTDDTVAIQAAIDACETAGGGTVYFPAGVYVVNGALQDTGRSNAQLLLPRRDYGDTEAISITLRGAFPPPPIVSVGATTPLANNHSILKGTLNTASGTSPSMIGAWGPAGTLESFTNILVKVVDLGFSMPADPALTACNFSKCAGIDIDNVMIDAGSFYLAGMSAQTTAASFGLMTPVNNNGAFTRIGALNVVGYYNGIDVSEHCNGEQVSIWGCRNAVTFRASNHASHFSRLMTVHCQNGLVFTGGVHATKIEQFNIEHASSGTWVTTYDVNDASNYARGSLYWHVVLAGTGADNTFTVNGANKLKRHHPQATVATLTDGATITPNFTISDDFRVTLGGNRTLANPTTPYDGQSGNITVIQDGTGSRTLAYGSKWKFPGGAPTLSTAAGAVDIIAYHYDATSDLLRCAISKALA